MGGCKQRPKYAVFLKPDRVHFKMTETKKCAQHTLQKFQMQQAEANNEELWKKHKLNWPTGPARKWLTGGSTPFAAKRRIKMCTNLGRHYGDDSLENHCGLELWSVTETLLQPPHSCLLAHRSHNKHWSSQPLGRCSIQSYLPRWPAARESRTI